MLWHHDKSEKELLVFIGDRLEQIVQLLKHTIWLLEPRLTYVELLFTSIDPGETEMSTAAVTLQVGQVTTATVVGFDQNGNPFTGVIPQPSFSVDNPAIVSIAPNAAAPEAEDCIGLAAGTANLSVGVAGPNGTTLVATGVITVQPAASQPVLTSIGIEFSAPASTGQGQAAVPQTAFAKSQVAKAV